MSELDDARAAVVELESKLARNEPVTREERHTVHGRYQEASLAAERKVAETADPGRPAPQTIGIGN